MGFSKTKWYRTSLSGPHVAVTTHLNSAAPKITHTSNTVVDCREYRDANDYIIWKEDTDIDQFRIDYFAATEHNMKVAGTDTFDLSLYGDVKLTNVDLERTYGELDKYNFVGNCDVSIDGGAVVNYDQCWIQVNRHGGHVRGQLFKTGDTDAKIVVGFLSFPVLPENVPIGTNVSSVLEEQPEFQNLRVMLEQPPSSAPPVSGILISDIGPTAVANFADIPSNAPVTFNILDNDLEETLPIDPASIVLIDPNNSVNIGVTGTPLVIATEGTYEVNSFGDLTFTPEPLYSGFARVNYTVKDTAGSVSNIAEVTILVNI